MSRITKDQRVWIRERDNFVCQMCGRKVKYGEVHHITPYSIATKVLEWSIPMANSPTNLILLCARPCHLMLHSKPTMSRYWQNLLGEKALHNTLRYVKELGRGQNGNDDELLCSL